MTPAGFPHSDIPGSQPACGAPRLFVACYVLRRRSAPRHPPFTLSSLTTHHPKHLRVQLWKTQSSCQRPSQGPVRPRGISHRWTGCREDRRGLVEQIGLEPTTSALQGRRSPN